MITRLNQVVGSSRQATNLTPTQSQPPFLGPMLAGTTLVASSSSSSSSSSPAPPTSSSSSSVNINELVKESFLSKALQLLANIMEISFPVYHEFLKNYPKAMTILNKLEKSPSAASRSIHLLSKRKSFIECQLDFNKILRGETAANTTQNDSVLNNSSSLATTTTSSSSSPVPSQTKKIGFLSKITTNVNSKTSTTTNTNNLSRVQPTTAVQQQQPAVVNKDPFNIYYGDIMKRSAEEKFDIARMLSEDILRRPTKLFEFTCSLKDECMLASKDLPSAYRANMESNIKSLFDNESSKKLREKVFDEINRNIMPIEVRKSEDVVELIESNGERKLRYLILYGDCLVCCRLKK